MHDKIRTFCKQVKIRIFHTEENNTRTKTIFIPVQSDRKNNVLINLDIFICTTKSGQFVHK